MKKLFLEHKIKKIIFLSISILLTGFIIVQSCLPGSLSSIQSDWLTELIAKIFNVAPTSELAQSIRKGIGHFTFFLIEGVFLILTVDTFLFKKNKFSLISAQFAVILIGLLLAAITEIIQLFVPGRAGDIHDVQIDFSGFLIGVFVTSIILYFVNKNVINN